MSSGNVKKKITQVALDHIVLIAEGSHLFQFESIVFAIIGGLYFQSWYIGAGIFFGLILASQIRKLNLLIAVLLSACWSIVINVAGTVINAAGAAITASFSDIMENLNGLEWYQIILTFYSNPASQVIGVIVFICALGTYVGAIYRQKNLSNQENSDPDPDDSDF